MWLRPARSCLLARTLALVLAAVVAGGAVDWGHTANDDPGCSPVLVLHDHEAHQFKLPGTPAPPDHCFICHSLRLLHGALVATLDPFVVDVSSSRSLGSTGALTRLFD